MISKFCFEVKNQKQREKQADWKSTATLISPVFSTEEQAVYEGV